MNRLGLFRSAFFSASTIQKSDQFDPNLLICPLSFCHNFFYEQTLRAGRRYREGVVKRASFFIFMMSGILAGCGSQDIVDSKLVSESALHRLSTLEYHEDSGGVGDGGCVPGWRIRGNHRSTQ